MSNDIKWKIAKTKNGELVPIAEAQKDVDYFCPECEAPFVARLGVKNKHHFAHHPGWSGECTGESDYHNNAKYLLALKFEREPEIITNAKCYICARNYEEKRTVVKPQVEKGEFEYRPDVRLPLVGGDVIVGEVIYKNPMSDDKVKTYQAHNANLIVWEISGEAESVPPIKQYHWGKNDDLPKPFGIGKEMDETNLHFFNTAPSIPKHECIFNGEAYVGSMECWKCNKITPVALLGDYYSIWDDHKGSGLLPMVDDYLYATDDPWTSGFWRGLNKEYGTRIRQNYSKAAEEQYLMNHCKFCGMKIGGSHVQKYFNANQDSFKKVIIIYVIGDTEKETIAKQQIGLNG